MTQTRDVKVIIEKDPAFLAGTATQEPAGHQCPSGGPDLGETNHPCRVTRSPRITDTLR
jgi:hypothetical protein